MAAVNVARMGTRRMLVRPQGEPVGEDQADGQVGLEGWPARSSGAGGRPGSHWLFECEIAESCLLTTLSGARASGVRGLV